MQINIKKTE